ncbi:MAG TPA: hypothetical protein VFP69_21325 [Streptomyces sp.]|nr:hypothetical protein [Streptomyces sp.]
MTRFPAAAPGAGSAAVPVGVLATAVLLGMAWYAGGGSGQAGPEHGTALSSASGAAGRPPAGRATPGAPPMLGERQARSALVTQDDLGGPWLPTRGAATWRDGLLKATTGDVDCHRLLDALYTDDLFGVPGGPRATVALDDVDTGAQLRHQVVSYRAAELDRTLDWMRTLPDRCGLFTATASATAVEAAAVSDAEDAGPARGRSAEVRVTEVPLPAAGDARQGLRVTVTGTDADGRTTVLTLEVAAVRVGDDAVGVTNGGLDGVVADTTRAVTELAAHRLTEARKQGRAQV